MSRLNEIGYFPKGEYFEAELQQQRIETALEEGYSGVSTMLGAFALRKERQADHMARQLSAERQFLAFKEIARQTGEKNYLMDALSVLQSDDMDEVSKSVRAKSIASDLYETAPFLAFEILEDAGPANKSVRSMLDISLHKHNQLWTAHKGLGSYDGAIAELDVIGATYEKYKLDDRELIDEIISRNNSFGRLGRAVTLLKNHEGTLGQSLKNDIINNLVFNSSLYADGSEIEKISDLVIKTTEKQLAKTDDEYAHEDIRNNILVVCSRLDEDSLLSRRLKEIVG